MPQELADLYPDSQHIREVGMKASQDLDIWDYAKANGFVIVHEAHHRGQIVMIARQLGHRLSAEVTGGLWQWTKRADEARG